MFPYKTAIHVEKQDLYSHVVSDFFAEDKGIRCGCKKVETARLMVLRLTEKRPGVLFKDALPSKTKYCLKLSLCTLPDLSFTVTMTIAIYRHIRGRTRALQVPCTAQGIKTGRIPRCDA